VEIPPAADSDTSLQKLPHAVAPICDNTPATIFTMSVFSMLAGCPNSWTKGDVTTSRGAVTPNEGYISTKGAIELVAVISLEGEYSRTADESKSAACVPSSLLFDT
jgi:hypothetical protein